MKFFFTSLLFLTTIIVNSQTPITNSNINTAINTCLTTNPVDGLCSDSEYGSITEWDVSNVTNMKFLFFDRESFNGNISSWDVSSVTTMNSMFNFSSSFNQDLSNWDVSSVTNMFYMFRTTDSFNQEISSWDVSNVTNMDYMFEGSVFNQDISGWCATNFSSEPQGFSANSPLTESNKPVWGSCPGTPIDDSNFQTAVNTCLSTHPITGLCTDSEYGSITEWDVSNVTDMSNAFKDRIGFNGNISSWDVSSVTSMVSMFEGGTSFIGNISNWDVSSVTNMEYMFYNVVSFNRDISNWDVSSVTNMEYMFYNAVSFNRDIMFWDVENVINMDYMFYNAESFNQDISIWCVTNFSSEPESFSDNSPLIESNKPVWGTCLLGTFIDDSNFLTAINTCLFTNPVDGMCSDSEYGAMPTWDVRYVTSMSGAFYYRLTFNGDISSWDVSNVTDMSNMFRESLFNQDVGSWNVSNVTNATGLFHGTDFNQDISSWNVESMTDMSNMFRESLFNQDIGIWETGNVTNMAGMFFNSSFNQDISGWCVTNISSEPESFSNNSPLIESNKPVWGSCPGVALDLSFSNVSDIPEKISFLTTSKYNNDIYINTGLIYKAPSNLSYNFLFKYNTISGSWSKISTNTLLENLYAGNGEIINNKLYRFNGKTSDGINSKLEIIDLDDLTVTLGTENPLPRLLSGSAVNGKYIYVFGGETQEGYTNKLYRYNTETDTWIKLSEMPESKQTRGEFVNNKLYVIGGFNGTVSNKMNVFNTDTDIWENEYTMPFNVSANALTVNDNYIYILGDYSDQDKIEVLDTNDMSFRSLKNNMIGRRLFDAEIIDDKLYVIGGSTTGSLDSYLNSIQSSNINTNSLSVNEQSVTNKLLLYPNPVTDKLFIKGITSNYKILIYSYLGNLVMSKTNSDDIDTKNLASGIYILKIIDTKGETVLKFIKN